MKPYIILCVLFVFVNGEKKINLEDIERDNLKAESRSKSDDNKYSYKPEINQHYPTTTYVTPQPIPNVPPEEYRQLNKYSNEIIFQQSNQPSQQYKEYQQQTKNIPTIYNSESTIYQPELNVGNQAQTLQQKVISQKFGKNPNKDNVYIDIPMGQLLSYYPHIDLSVLNSGKIQASLQELSQAQQISIPFYTPLLSQKQLITPVKMTYQILPQYTLRQPVPVSTTLFPKFSKGPIYASLTSKKPISPQVYEQPEQSYPQGNQLLYTQAYITQPQQHQQEQQQQQQQQQHQPRQQQRVSTVISNQGNALYTQTTPLQANPYIKSPVYVQDNSLHGQINQYNGQTEQSYISSVTEQQQPKQILRQDEESQSVSQNYVKIPDEPNSDFIPPQVSHQSFKPDVTQLIQISSDPDESARVKEHIVSSEPRNLLDTYVPSNLIAAQDSVLTCLILGLVILSDSAKKNLEESQNKLNERKDDDTSFITETVNSNNEKVEERLDDDPDDPDDSPENEFPILPPLILLDFNNDTIDSNTTGEEKSKRTVNNGLGYGFEKNSLFSGKTNYYFPAGNTGTTVSIEESISPFLPRTIIEKYIPNNSNPNKAAAYYNLQGSQTNYRPSTKLQKVTNYYDTYDTNYRTKDERLQSSTPSSTTTTSTQRPQNHFDVKSSRYLLSNLNVPSYPITTNINTDNNGHRVNIFRPTVQTYVERGQNVFQPTIPTKPTSLIDDTKIFKVDYTDHRYTGQANPNYFGFKQNQFRTIPSSLSQSQGGSQVNNFNDVHSQTYNDPRLSKTVSTTPNSLETNSQNYRYYQNIFYPIQQYYHGKGQHLRVASQDPLVSNNQDFSNNRNHYQNYAEQRQNDPVIFTTPTPETNYEYVQNPTTQANLPRYTIENGVRYENKIFWKYPDGRISHEPPTTYIETYTEDSTVSPEISKIQETYIETNPSTEYSVRAQGPIQFPISPELPSQQNRFVSSESLSSNLSHQQAYRIGYQNLVSQKPNVLLAQKAQMEYTAATASSFVSTTPFSTTRRPILSSTRRPMFSTKKKQDRNNLSLSYTTSERPVSRYMVNGPNAEYVDSTESTLKLKPGQLTGHILSRYKKPSVENYLKIIFTANNRDVGNKGKQQSGKNLSDYNNLQYSDLLSYNPSISQYIKDPSSILNVRPTFVQAGNSLVPVIILRVDGVPPVQPKTTSNINLKALLQEYLIQYANSIKELAQPTNYELGVEQFSQTQRTIQAGNRLLQLVRQSQNDKIESSSPSTILSHSYPDPKNYEENVFLAGEETRSVGKFGDRTNVRPKTKSVQIIDDPRFTTYDIIVLFLCWPNARGFENAESQDETIFDQLATASENIRTLVKTVPPPIDTSIHYENSNGFIPMTPATITQRYQQHVEFITATTLNPRTVYDDQENSSTPAEYILNVNRNFQKDKEKLENDLVYSPEARIFLDLPHSGTNRRSFEFQDDQNTFELLKVHNDTPAIANYNDFYENIDDLSEPDDTETDNSSINESKRDRRKRVNSYATSYGTVNGQSAKTEENVYDRYHSYGATKDEKRTIQKPEKVTSNYHQRNTVNYNGHGQSTTKQKPTETSTSSRTNFEDNDSSNRKSLNYYDSSSSSSSSNGSKNRHKFMKPVVVVDPNNYKIELNFDTQSSNSPSPVTTGNHFKDSDTIAAESSNVYNRYRQEARGRSYDRDDSSDDSNDSLDYMDYIEKPRRVNKNKRRPHNAESSRRLPKEHRTVTEDSMETESYRKPRPSTTRSKPHRQRGQSTAWIDDDRNRNEDDSTEERVQESRMRASQMKHQKSQKHQNVKSSSSNGWRQLGPNIEISHSNGIEISPTDKSNLVIPVGLMSIANFDHATALDNSQGFDVSNVVYQNLVTPTPIGTVSTANTPILGSHQSTVGHNIVTASNVPRTLTNLPNIQNVRIPTAIPDIIVGQNSFQSPTHTVLVPHQTNFPNKIASNSNAQYVSSTITPIFAVTTRLNPTLQNVRVQNLPNNVTPRTAFATTSPTSNLQQITVNQMQQGISHLFVPQPTIQTLPNLLQAPAQSSPEYNIQVNPHGLQGQNTISQGTFQIPNYPIHTATTPSPQFTPVTRVNLITADPQSKKTFIPATGGNILASASFTVGQNSQMQSNDNNYPSQANFRPIPQDNLYRVIKDDNNMSKTKTYLQTASLVPFYHPVPPLDDTALNQQASQSVQSMNFLLPRLQEQNAQYQNVLHQLQLQLQQGLRNNKYTNYPYQTSDTVGSQTISNANVVNSPQDNNFAHLPKVGAKNVEIMNPNIRPSPVDTSIVHPLPALHYPILTTPIPILTSTPISLITPTPSYIDSLTEIGTKPNHQSTSTMDMKTSQNQDKPIFNPINFVPNTDVIKNQNVLNSKLQNHDSLQQPLNLVPMMPEGNFYKPTFAAQSELLTKPKLTTDLEKYAEEMFKESLRTIYNSQKWNNDRKVQSSNNQTHVEPNDIAALKNELMRLKATFPDTKQNKEILEAYQSENKIRTTEANKLTSSGNDQKKPDPFLATLEELLKTQQTETTHMHHGHRHKHNRKRPYSSNTKHLRDFLTPPKPNSFHPTSHFHEKPSKKRPGSSLPRFMHHSHSHFEGPRHSKKNAHNSKPIGPEVSASNTDGVRVNRPNYSDFRKPLSIDDYPTFTTSAPTDDDINKFLKELRSPSSTETNKYDINHPRMHNLLALLMKNKQLPSGNKPNYFSNRDQLRQFFEDEKRRLQEQFYNDTIKTYLDKNSDDVSSRMMPRSSNTDTNAAAKSTEIFRGGNFNYNTIHHEQFHRKKVDKQPWMAEILNQNRDFSPGVYDSLTILYLIVSIVAITKALNVPNSSEESEDIKSSKYVPSSLNTNQKLLNNEESIKSSVTSDNYNPVQRSQNYQRMLINQNPATGGFFLSPYQVNQPYTNLGHFSTPYFGHGFINSELTKPTMQYRTITLPNIQQMQETSTNLNEDDQKKILGNMFAMHYENPFLINQKLSSSSTDTQIEKEVPANKVQVPIYRTQYPGPRNSEYIFTYPPNHQSESIQKLSQYFPQKETTDVKKVTLPVVRVTQSENLPDYLRSFETQPVILNHNLNYQQPRLNFGIIGGKEKSIGQGNNVSPFQSSISSFQGQVIPIQTASSTPEFPQYKGASVSQYPGSLDHAKIPRTYEPLRTQPQLHFQNVQPSGIVPPYQNVNLNTKPGGEILEDVDIITSNPPPPLKNDEEDDPEDERYKSVETEYGHNSNDEEEYSAKPSKESSSESDFVPSKSFPFKEYDEKFGKYFKKNNKNNDDDDDDDDDDEKTISTKFVNYSSSENDDDGRSSKDSTDYDSESRRSNYEDEEEDGSEKYESRREPEEQKKSRNFRKDFDDKDFDDFYKKPITKNKYNSKSAELKHQKGGFLNHNKQSNEEENHPFIYNRKKNFRKFSDSRKRGTESVTNDPIGLTSNSRFYVPSILNTKHRSFGNEKVFRDLTGI
ncbi:hypothetical protein M0802_004464 [Mischocyttarus mexicanus]|nr:hypothetical protein M0802_004464 [Mischocyttarus mexicanus]